MAGLLLNKTLTELDVDYNYICTSAGWYAIYLQSSQSLRVRSAVCSSIGSLYTCRCSSGIGLQIRNFGVG